MSGIQIERPRTPLEFTRYKVWPVAYITFIVLKLAEVIAWSWWWLAMAVVLLAVAQTCETRVRKSRTG